MNAKAKKEKSGGGKATAVALPKEMVSLLEKGFQPLNKHSAGLASEVVRYVVEGRSEDVLDVLDRLKKAGEIIELNGARYFDTGGDDQWHTVHAQFLKRVDCKDAAFYVRLAEVYEACARRMRNEFGCLSMF